MIQSCLAVGEKIADRIEVIVVDDGSVDRTGAIAEKFVMADQRVRVIRHPQNRGYGAALQSGFNAACFDIVFYTDGDCQFDVAQLHERLLLINDCDIVSCYRMIRQDGVLRHLNSMIFGVALRLLFGLKVRDVNCAFKIFRQEVLDAIILSSRGALIDAEMLIRANRAGFRIKQASVRHYPRQAGTQSGADLPVVLRAMWEIVRLRWQLR